KRPVRTRRDEEVLSGGRVQHGVQALRAGAGGERQPRPVRKNAVHREPVAVEVVAGRVEDDEVHAGRGRLIDAVPAPEERVVERVEVHPLGDRGALAVDLAVVADRVALQPRGRLDRRAVADPAAAAEVPLDAARTAGPRRALGDRLYVLADFHARPEDGIDALLEVEVEKPRL